MYHFVLIACVLSCVWFIWWQWKMVKKYALTYDKLKINRNEKYITIQKRQINFTDINFVSVKELPPPALWEKALSKSAFYAYMAQVEFHLTDGTILSAKFNSKAALYKALKELEAVVPVRANIDLYKPASLWWLLLWAFMLGMIIFIFKVG